MISKEDPVQTITLELKRLCVSQMMDVDVLVHRDFAYDAMLVELRAGVWGERRTKLVQVPDGPWEAIKQVVRAKLPRRWRGLIKVRSVDWEAEVFKAYPELRINNVRGQRFAYHVCARNLTLLNSYSEDTK